MADGTFKTDVDEAHQDKEHRVCGPVVFEMGGETSDEDSLSEAAATEGGECEGEDEAVEAVPRARARAAALSDALAHEAAMGDLEAVQKLLGAAGQEALSRAVMEAALHGHVDVAAATIARGTWGMETQLTRPGCQEQYVSDWLSVDPAGVVPFEQASVGLSQPPAGGDSGFSGKRLLELAALVASITGRAAVIKLLQQCGVSIATTYSPQDCFLPPAIRPLGWLGRADHPDATSDPGTFREHFGEETFWMSDVRFGLLRQAAFEGHVAVVGQLLALRADPASGDVIAAARSGRDDVIDILLSRVAEEASCDVQATIDNLGALEALLETRHPAGYTALTWAVLYGHTTTVKSLLDWAASPLSTDGNGGTALHFAAHSGKADVLESLLAAGEMQAWFGEPPLERRNAQNHTPLTVAAMKGNAEAVRLLLAHGADPRSEGGAGNSAEACAALMGHREVAAMLRQHRQLQDSPWKDSIGAAAVRC